MRLLVCVGILVVASTARADTSVAVLPLTLGAGSEEYAGLGDALAGMVVADLSVVDGLQLVERSKLSSLLDELHLAETEFVDPASAQRLGRGLGAEVVLVGSFSVVRDTFALDARLVGVESGAVVKASAAHGTVDDFVSVEKSLVEDLVSGLDVALTAAAHRKLLGRVSTESFPALAAYGRGLHAEGAGELDAAASAYEDALKADPAYAEASEALRGVRAAVEAAKAGEKAYQDAKAARGAAWVLAAFPDERTRGARYADTDDDLTGFALRMSALYADGRECDRYAELWHFWERRGDPAIDASLVGWGGRFWQLADEHEVKVDLWPRYFSSRAEFVLDLNGGLLITLERCFPAGPGQDAELERVLARVDATGGYDDPPHDEPWSTVGRELELTILRRRVDEGRVDEDFRKRVDALLARHPEGTPYRDMLISKLDAITTAAEKAAKP